MIKKYFALSLVTASMVVAGCSSDSNDEPPAPTTPAATPGVGGTAFDTIAESDVHNTLQAAIEAAGLDDALDDPASTFTIFAPTDAAFTELDNDGDDATPTTADLLADIPTLTRILSYHVISGDVSSTAASDLVTAGGDAGASADSILVDGDTTQTLALTTSTTAASGLAVNGVDIGRVDLGADVEGAIGRVHEISSLLSPPAAPEPVDPGPTEPGPTEPTPGAGDVQAALESAGNFGGFLSSFGAAYGLQKLDAETDADPWTVFAPTDAALAGADLVVNDHIATGNKLSPADLLAAGTFTSFNGNSYAVAGTEDALTVGGFAVAVVGEGASITYSIDGVLQ